MPTFELTPEQEAMIFMDLFRSLTNGMVFAHIGLTQEGVAICTAKHVDKEVSEKIKELLWEEQ